KILRMSRDRSAAALVNVRLGGAALEAPYARISSAAADVAVAETASPQAPLATPSSTAAPRMRSQPATRGRVFLAGGCLHAIHSSGTPAAAAMHPALTRKRPAMRISLTS